MTLVVLVLVLVLDLELDRIVVVHAGEHRFPLDERVEAVPAATAIVEGLGTA